MANATTDRREWGDATTVEAVFGLKRGVLYELAGAGEIKSTSLRKRGQTRGKRLFSMDSIAAHLERQAEVEHGKLKKRDRSGKAGR